MFSSTTKRTMDLAARLVGEGVDGAEKRDYDYNINILQRQISKNEKGAWLADDQDILLIMSTKGVAYTVDSTYEFDFFNEKENKYEDYIRSM